MFPGHRPSILGSAIRHKHPAILVVLPFLLSLLGPIDSRGAGTVLYSIQVGAFKDQQNAVKEVAYLKGLGHQAFYMKEKEGGGGTYYRVYIDRFESKKTALEEAKLMKRLGLISDYAVKALNQKTMDDASPKPETGREVVYLHVGSFKDHLHAAKKVQELENKGFQAFFLNEEVSGITWYRVYIGEFDTPDEASRLGSTLKSNGSISYFKLVIIDKNALTSGKNQSPK